jgi:hypothetical protein
LANRPVNMISGLLLHFFSLFQFIFNHLVAPFVPLGWLVNLIE